MRKRQYLLQEGEVCKAIAFVEKGALREIKIENGSDRIIQFAIEGWTISDLLSSLTNEPATYNVDVMEDAQSWLYNQDCA
ncbi:Crp/Fnr family transcriptional regulator [Pontibacter sp. 13R65]|uniref:Crp/Fnr family transcriptional regulator n=1 Tax=Pontibacter sp. 13R65 TaxID=3127458 RepID=UPI00301DBF85